MVPTVILTDLFIAKNGNYLPFNFINKLLNVYYRSPYGELNYY